MASRRALTLLASLLLGCAHQTSASIGMGMATGTRESGGAAASGLTVTGDTKLSYPLGANLGVGLWSHLAYGNFGAVGSAYRWLAEAAPQAHPLLWPLFGVGYLTAWLVGANTLAGGAMVTWSPQGAGPYLDLGLGPSLNMSFAGDGYFVHGISIAAGAGWDFDNGLGTSLRLVWTPASLHGRVSSGDSDLVAASLLLRLR